MSDKHHFHGRTWRLLSMVLCAIMILSIISPITTQSARAQVSPTPIYPENNANTTPATDPPLGVPTFAWSTVDGATNYRLQVDNDTDFASTIMNIVTTSTSYTPDATNYLFADNVWLYWRVRVETPLSEWSEPLTFTKTWATYDNNPLLLSPDDGSTLYSFTDPDFSWTPVIGAARYRFQISIDPDNFSTTAVSIDTLKTSAQPNVRLANGTYYWRVLPMDAKDQLGTPSEVRSFILAYGTGAMVPTLIEPADLSHPTFTPTFRWAAVEGAEKYRLEYSSDINCDFGVGASLTLIITRQTTYTPTDTFPNDRWYCWHVRVESGSAAGEWTETWRFQKQWYLQPQLLTPTNLYQTALYPVYSWTPVPGTAYYKIEIANNSSFISPLTQNVANTSYTPSDYIGTAYYYWRVTPYDGGGEKGLTSDVWEFQSYYTSTAPILVYPPYYYLPNNYGDYDLHPYEDRTVALPVFIWHRVMNPSDEGGIYAPAYRIQVDDYPHDFTTVLWQHDTENTHAAPTGELGDSFVPVVGEDYWWRVCPLDEMGGRCLTNPATGYEWWSQVWRTRFDPSRALQPTPAVDPPDLLRPVSGQELVEATPMLEWWPVEGATKYELQISRDANFSTPIITETVTASTDIPVYSSSLSLAQRSLERIRYGTYYWHVRAYASGWGEYSDTWLFQIASQSEWRYNRTLGNPVNQVIIGRDPVDDVTENIYDLSTLFATQCYSCAPNNHAFWFYGFNANVSPADTTYVLYLDIIHEDGVGAPTPPATRNYSVSTIPTHQPEFAIYIDNIGSVINAANTYVFTWDETLDTWDPGQPFTSIGGYVYYSSGYIELQIPNAAIGMSEVNGSANVMLFSVNRATGSVEDSVPSDPQVPGSAHLSRFSVVSDRMNQVYPPNTGSGDPTAYPSVVPFFWDWPTGSNPSNPFAGSVLQVSLDPLFTNIIGTATYVASSSYFGYNSDTFLDDIKGDNTYYWRVRPRYKLPSNNEAFGVWSSAWSFGRLGFIAQNLQVSITSATPTFSWDKAEGASSYLLQVATDPLFVSGSIILEQPTPLNTFTPVATLAQGTYYWRVQVNRNGTGANDWSEVAQFTLTYPIPAGLTPDGEVVQYAPTFCWDAVSIAYKYRLQVSQGPDFTVIYDTIDTPNTCWTPTKGYKDGEYYWHVAMIDGNSKLGTYSETATFVKTYPVTTLISPISGNEPSTPSFVWQPVDGAASYRFEVSLSSSFSLLYDSTTTINTHFTPTKIYATNHVYYWRVAIKDRDGNQGPFTTGSFLIGKGTFFLPIITR